jgi:GR25 family glycosyltransferase involved in LPS biosynthesis
MRIGIIYNPSINLFLSELNQTALLLSELFLKLNIEVTLIDFKNCENDWWDYVVKPAEVKFSKLFQTNNLDYLIDIDGIISPEFRIKVSKNTIVFLRSFVQFTEMDNSVYPEKPYILRSFDNVKEIWCWDILNPVETLFSVQTLFKCPIKTVPFIWSPFHISQFICTDIKYNPDSEWNIYINEKNNSNISSSIIPLVAIREICNRNIIKAKYTVCNMDHILDNKYLKENILNNIEINKFPVKFSKEQEITKLCNEENIILLAHSRFIPINLELVNALWLGIPLIHNSSIIKNLHPTLNKTFYNGNMISEICSILQQFNEKFITEYNLSHNEIRNIIIEKWGIDNNLDKWKLILNFDKLVIKEDLIVDDNKIIIAFSDMWPGFNYNSNFIIDSLRNELYLNNINKEIIGIKYEVSVEPSVVIFGPYSNTWKLIPNHIKKIYFSGENWSQPDNESIKLFLTSSRIEDDRHIRVPTWMMFIDWFNKVKEIPTDCEDNPIRLPLYFAMNPHSISYEDRKEFCGFVVSNPVCDFRNYTFKVFNDYKKVNSGGALFNNIGGQLLLKYPGGGCGDISKHHFFSHHKFSISFENSQADGYITEKVLHSKMAGCIPIYWGDKNINTDFVEDSIVNVSKYQSAEEILEVLKTLENNKQLCYKIATTPILDEERKQKALVTISKMSQKILSLCNIKTNSLMGIDKIFVINLDTRKDRWDNFCKEEPYMASIVERVSAINGKNISLSPYIKTLFKNNTFGWKKAVMGCALSHIQIWTKIASSVGNYFLVLEDDVRFINNWNEYAKYIPDDSELLYIGGVLPPNKIALSSVLEPVNNYWAKIKPNRFFSPSDEVPLFHFCTYSYIISKSGAQKLLNKLVESENKMIYPIDHFLKKESMFLNTYVANPLITKCFQDDDPIYQNAEFNSETNYFDSDICNNTECFSDTEINEKDGNSGNNPITLYHMSNEEKLYEDKWIKDIFSNYSLRKLTNTYDIDDANCWFVVQRPYLNFWNALFKNLCLKNIDFKVIHLSDEASIDDITFYSYSNCKVVIRNYVRKDIAELKNVYVIPLGYHYNVISSNKFIDRKLIWSFHGNDWYARDKQLINLQSFSPHSCHLVQGWNSPTMTNEYKYSNTLANSKFCPILRGNNFETFRLYEALEAGVIPIYIRSEGDTDFWNFITSKIKLINFNSWDKVTEFITILLNNPGAAEKYRLELIHQWYLWKEEIRQTCSKYISS